MNWLVAWFQRGSFELPLAAATGMVCVTALVAGVRSLVAELLAVSPRFAELWSAGGVADWRGDRKAIRHPEVGLVEVDCDVYLVQGTDLRVVAYTAEPGSEAAQQLALTRVLGLQSLH